MTDVSSALIWQGNKFLICQRPPHKSRGLLWEFVGGKVEPGETWEQALIRECVEELDVRVEPGDIFMEVIHEYPDVKIRLRIFNTKIVEGFPKLIEHVAMKWISAGEISNYDFCPADKTILAEIKKRANM